MTGRPTGVTIIPGHGSFLTCHRRLGCTSERHRKLRAAYHTEKSREWRIVHGIGPAATGRPSVYVAGGRHGTRSKYRTCTDGPDGGKCEACKGAETDYKAEYRAAKRGDT